MSEVECPYCEADCGVPDDSYGEGELVDWECDGCKKKFVYYSQYSVDYYSQKAPCLNGGEHEWDSMVGAPAEHFKGRYRCKVCDKEKVVQK